MNKYEFVWKKKKLHKVITFEEYWRRKNEEKSEKQQDDKVNVDVEWKYKNEDLKYPWKIP